jgi:hypothetical protein
VCILQKDKLKLRKNRRKLEFYNKIKELLEKDQNLRQSRTFELVLKQLDSDLSDPRVQELMKQDKNAIKSAVQYYKQLSEKFETLAKMEEKFNSNVNLQFDDLKNEDNEQQTSNETDEGKLVFVILVNFSLSYTYIHFLFSFCYHF